MIKLIIFDLDGTLLNTIDDLATSANYALQKYGYPIHQLPDYPQFVGNGIRKLIERALPEEARTEQIILQVLEDFINYYNQHKTDLTRPYDGIPELLTKLHHHNILMAVASNKYQAGTEELIRLYFPNIPFLKVLGQREGFPLKPNPAIVTEILRTTDIEKSNVLYIGDSGVDMQTAINSQVIPVGVTWGFRPQSELVEYGARFIVQHPKEIAKLTE